MAATVIAVHPILAASDVTAALAFYARLGFREQFRWSDGEPRYAGVARDGVTLHLQWHDATALEHGGDRPAYRFLVSDVDALHAEFAAQGATAPVGSSPWAVPGDTPWGTREFHLRDPAGNVLQFYRE